MCGPVDLFVPLDLCINFFIRLLPPLIFLLVVFRATATEAPHVIRGSAQPTPTTVSQKLLLRSFHKLESVRKLLNYR